VTALRLMMLSAWLSVRHHVDIRVRRRIAGRLMIDAQRTGKSGVHKHFRIDDVDDAALRALRLCAPDLVSDLFYSHRAVFTRTVPTRAECRLCRESKESAP
jgi:hypothetical protein